MTRHTAPPLLMVTLIAAAGCAVGGRDTAAGAAGNEQAPSVLLDGSFDDWGEAATLIEDPMDDATGAVDLTTVLATDDPAWIYLSIGLGAPMNLQAMPGTLNLLVDADADESTGGEVFGMAGVDHVVELSQMARPQTGGHGAGFALRTVGPSGMDATRSAYELGVIGLPTWAADRFELRMSRAGAPDGFGRLGSAVRIGMVFATGSAVGDRTAVATYTFSTDAGPDPVVPSIEPVFARPDGAVRMAQWNVSEGSFRTPENHARLLAAVKPDIVVLDEVYEEISDDALAAFFSHPDLAALGSWQWVYSRAGGRQKTVVAARDRSIRQAASMARVEYAPGALDGLRSAVPPAGQGFLDREAQIHMSATGAWVDISGTEVLFVPVDLQSAGYLGSPQDMLRAIQAETLRDHVLAEIGPKGRRAPVVIGGDFNVVGSDEPLSIVAGGLDVDGSDLAVANPRRLGQATLATWQNAREGIFAPGRLDLTLYADAALEVVGGFVLDSGELTDAQLKTLGLERHLSSVTSDHLIVVTDLLLR